VALKNLDANIHKKMIPKDTNGDWHTMFLFEGIMIYLNDGVPSTFNFVGDHEKEGYKDVCLVSCR